MEIGSIADWVAVGLSIVGLIVMIIEEDRVRSWFHRHINFSIQSNRAPELGAIFGAFIGLFLGVEYVDLDSDVGAVPVIIFTSALCGLFFLFFNRKKSSTKWTWKNYIFLGAYLFVSFGLYGLFASTFIWLFFDYLFHVFFGISYYVTYIDIVIFGGVGAMVLGSIGFFIGLSTQDS